MALGYRLQSNPIVVDGVLYATTPKLRVIALDAKGVPQSRITARHAADLLAEEVLQRAGESVATVNARRRKGPSSESAAALSADAAQQPDVTPN